MAQHHFGHILIIEHSQTQLDSRKEINFNSHSSKLFKCQLYSLLGAWLSCCGNTWTVQFLWPGLLIPQQLGSKRKHAKKKCYKREEITISYLLTAVAIIGITSLLPHFYGKQSQGSTDKMQERMNFNSYGKDDKEVLAIFNPPKTLSCFMGQIHFR